MRRFGDSRAQPRISLAYRPLNGWSTAEKNQLPTKQMIGALRDDGVTRVDAKWRSRRHTLAVVETTLPSSPGIWD